MGICLPGGSIGMDSIWGSNMVYGRGIEVMKIDIEDVFVQQNFIDVDK